MIIYDIVHPSHAHMFLALNDHIKPKGGALFVTRNKDHCSLLVEAKGHTYLEIGKPHRSLLGQAWELAARTFFLLQLIRNERSKNISNLAIFTRNPAGVIAARVAGIPCLYDTDNGLTAGIQYHLARLLAKHISAPIETPLGRTRAEIIFYNSLKIQTYVRPEDHQVPQGRSNMSEPRSLIRRVSMEATHDRGVRGLPDNVEATLENVGFEFIRSSEGIAPVDNDKSTSRPQEFLQLLATASICVGDSGTVSAEAALLGVPSLFISDFARSLPYLNRLEAEGLIEQWSPDEYSDQRLAHWARSVDHELHQVKLGEFLTRTEDPLPIFKAWYDRVCS